VGVVNVLTVTPDVDGITDLFDVVMLNRYFGWYVDPDGMTAAERGLEADLEAWVTRE
jgi:beta-glucuronidase